MIYVGCHNGSAEWDGVWGAVEAWCEGVELRVPGEIWVRGTRLRLEWIRGKAECKGVRCGGVWRMHQNRVHTMSEVTAESDPVEHSTCWVVLVGWVHG